MTGQNHVCQHNVTFLRDIILSHLLWQDERFCNSQASKGAMTQPPSPLWGAHFSPMTPALWNTNQFALQKHDVWTLSSAKWSYLLHCKQRLMYFCALRFGLHWSGWFALGRPAHEDYLSSSPTFPTLPAPFRNNSPPRFPLKESHISSDKNTACLPKESLYNLKESQIPYQIIPDIIPKNPICPNC